MLTLLFALGALAQDVTQLSGVWQILVDNDRAWEYDWHPDRRVIFFSDVNRTSRALSVLFNDTTRLNLTYEIDQLSVVRGRLELTIFTPFAPRPNGSLWTFESGDWSATRMVGTDFDRVAGVTSPLDFVRTADPVVYRNVPLPSTTASSSSSTTTTTATTTRSTSASQPKNDSLTTTGPTVVPLPSTTAATAADNTVLVAATPTSSADVALIAGVVGGIAALLLVVGAVAALVLRRRRSTAAPDGTVMVPPTSEYASTAAAFRPADAPHYDRLTPKEAAESHYEATGADFKPKDVAHYDRLTPQEAGH